MNQPLTAADRARITIACARTVLTDIQTTPLGDPVATARMLGRAETTIKQLLELIEADRTSAAPSPEVTA